MNYTDRYQQLTTQASYRRRIEDCGLAALLAPYTIRTPRLPRQRRAVPTSRAFHAV